MKLCKQSASDTTIGAGQPAVNSRPLNAARHAVQTPASDSGVKRLDKKAMSAGGKNKSQQAAWK